MRQSCTVFEIYRTELFVESRKIFLPHAYFGAPVDGDSIGISRRLFSKN